MKEKAKAKPVNFSLQTDPSTQHSATDLAQVSVKIVTGSSELDPVLVQTCREAATEGLVLLRNDNNCLPLLESDSVSVFGRVQYDYMYVGYGSGGDVNPPYTVSLIEGLERCGSIQLDQKLASIYRNWCQDNPPDEGFWADWPRYFEEMPVSEELVSAAANKSSKAIVVIGRAAGEDRENVLEPGSFYLTDDEKQLLELVTTAFANTIVILDCGNIIDLSWLADYEGRVQALVYAWQGGMESGNALADVLTGTVNPSGRLTDTIARRYEDYPGADDFLGMEFNKYSEDIFVGYRYFETFAPEAVLFPFGYGLSYCSFNISADSFEVVDDIVTVRVVVTNTGTNHAGREVIQLYVQAPQGKLGKASRVLAAFAKTGLIQPGDQEIVSLSVPLAMLSSYDDNGKSGHRSAYVLESGVYQFHIGSNVRETVPAGNYELQHLRVVEQLRENAAVEPRHAFDRMIAVGSEDGTVKFEYETVPVGTVDLAERILSELPGVLSGLQGDEMSELSEMSGAEMSNQQEVPGLQGDEMSEPIDPPKLLSLSDVQRGHTTLEQFVSSLTLQELSDLSRGDITMDSSLGAPGNAGVFGGVSSALRARGIPPITTCDGPSGIRVSYYASLLPCGTALASTWNMPLLEKLAASHGAEMKTKSVDVLLAPGMNIHRNPLCGRNFEYYSEDPLLTGKAAVAVVRGLQSQDVAACPKHFACNNQETNRNRHDSRVSERALREIYLKGFEICVKEASPLTIMSSYNKVNGIWSHYHYDLCTSILRREWGYEGLIMTDWWMQNATDPTFPSLTNNAYRVRAQVDVLMPGSSKHLGTEADDSLLESYHSADGITLGELQRTAMNVLGFALKSYALKNNARKKW